MRESFNLKQRTFKERRDVMGDKGGKKDKEKGQKQNAEKQKQKSKDKFDKQPKRKLQ
jgi:hypothetical protein